MTIACAIAVGLGLVGFLIGIAEPVSITRATPTPKPIAETGDDITSVPSYREIHSGTVGPNADWSSKFATLKQDRPDLFATVIRTPELKQAALEDRLRTRAFDGAPPVIPHQIEHQSAVSCLVCHGEGLKLGDRIATKVSHPHFANCLQCHVEQAGSIPVTDGADRQNEPVNEFVGVLRSGPGSRAMLGAPPTIPHTLQLRGDCLSCHGLVARQGLRTTHPWLQNCLQCHAADAAAERAFSTVSTDSPESTP
jgi:cytochrome c-type protein NapB